MIDRRTFVGLGLAAGAAAIARAAPGSGDAAVAAVPAGYADSAVQRLHPLEFRLDDSYRPDLSDGAARSLARAVRAFLDDEHPDGLTMTFWDLHPSKMPFLDRHLDLVVGAVLAGVGENLGRRPVDPLLVLALLYNESRFHPKVVSPAGAVGMAQFMPETALEYGLAPVAHADLWEAYRAAREARRGARAASIRAYRATHGGIEFGADAAIARALATGDVAVLADYRAIADAPDPSEDARRAYVAALEATFAVHEFFWDGREPLGKIDARVGYGAVRAAVRYLAGALGDWQGLASTAVAAYNAGPGAVRPGGRNSILHRFGDVPAYPETVRYVQRFAAVYSALKYRLYRLEGGAG